MSAAFKPGTLVIGGFDGADLPASIAHALRDERLGGVTLFKRNLPQDLDQIAALTREIHRTAALAPFIGVDQEGGRVYRIGSPLLQVPPMRTVASWGDVALAERVAAAVGRELATLGFTVVFAPVLDANTREDNPVIGDRSFGSDPTVCARFGAAWIRGLQSSGVLATGKHFPGHGDTFVDSHLALPFVQASRERLEQIELVPFRAAVDAGVAALMTAHVVYRGLDPDRPATLSATACTELRGALGFAGVLLSDDLEMKAIASGWTIEDAAVQALAAGCDALLVCATESLQERAVEALSREAEHSSAFRARCAEAAGRVMAARRRISVAPPALDAGSRAAGSAEARAIADEIRGRLVP
jgi:beta-N-acetylhexosaminidase